MFGVFLFFCFLYFSLFKSSTAYKSGSIKTFESTIAAAFKFEGKDLMIKSKVAGDAPQLCPDGELPKGKLHPAPDLKG